MYLGLAVSEHFKHSVLITVYEKSESNVEMMEGMINVYRLINTIVKPVWLQVVIGDAIVRDMSGLQSALSTPLTLVMFSALRVSTRI